MARPKEQKNRIELDKLNTNGGTQCRAEINKLTVQEYQSAFEEGVALPPIVVYHDTNKDEHYLADGFHRVAAARNLGLLELEAEIRKGTYQDALHHALSANAAHGLRRTTDDKKVAVRKALDLHPDYTSRQIADLCRVDGKFVEGLREDTGPRVGKDGRQYQGKRERQPQPEKAEGGAKPEPAPSNAATSDVNETPEQEEFQDADEAYEHLKDAMRKEMQRWERPSEFAEAAYQIVEELLYQPQPDGA